MKKLSKEEQKIYNGVIKHAKPKELLIIAWWSLFNKKKMDKLHQCIMNGMNWNTSFISAKNYNEINKP